MSSRLRLNSRKSQFSSEELESSGPDGPIQEPDFKDEETWRRMEKLIPQNSLEAIDITKPVVEVGSIRLAIGKEQVELSEEAVQELYIIRNFASESSITLTFKANTVLYGLRYLIKTTSFEQKGVALRLNFGMILPSKQEQVHTVYLDLSRLPKLDNEDYHKFYLELGTDDGRLFAQRVFKLSLKDVKGIKDHESFDDVF
ncbi:hypothetical protein L596_003768 [Steinernema carpocapsae]|uniref:Uncharacterized protein n=1 Tax=Steinernema carpocapsae TaxID=34508 RepID=A0A4U8UTH5_STECR|nr:hypothetical protein L596_003768 [Steinernema carpocapsae]